MKREIILTHCGKLGDMLYSLPVASWVAREKDCRIHYVLPRMFGPFRQITNLLVLQPFISRVTLVDYEVKHYGCGGQPYRFDPADYGVGGEFYNLGFRSYPDYFVTKFYADEHGFGYDEDFTLKITSEASPDANMWSENTGKIYRSSEEAMQMLFPKMEALPTDIDLLSLARMIATAKEFHSWFCGLATLCWAARIPAHVYRMPGHGEMRTYFPDPRNLTIHELKKHPKELAVEVDDGIREKVAGILGVYPLTGFRSTWSLVKEENHGEIYVHDWLRGRKRHVANGSTLKLLGYDALEIAAIPSEYIKAIKNAGSIRVI